MSRTVEIDTTGGPGFGLLHFKDYDFLADKEVVLTFDDGPWSSTPAALKALADQCVLATFFAIGKHAVHRPAVLRDVARAGHTIGTHTWSHVDLAKTTPEAAQAEIERAFSAVKWALDGEGQAAPFFRFPMLSHPYDTVAYLGTRNIATFSTDIDAFDYRMRRPEQVLQSVMSKLDKNGKGIVMLHDFRRSTAQALPELLARLKAGGYKIVHMRPRLAVSTLPQYDKEFSQDRKIPVAGKRPASNVVKTIP